MNGIPALRQVVLDSTDARGLAEFYRRPLGYHYRPGDEAPPPGEPDPAAEEWLVIHGDGGSPRLAFQPVAQMAQPTWPAGGVPQQLHLDLTVASKAELDAAHDRVMGLAPACSTTGPTIRTSRCGSMPMWPATPSASSWRGSSKAAGAIWHKKCG